MRGVLGGAELRLAGCVAENILEEMDEDLHSGNERDDGGGGGEDVEMEEEKVSKLSRKKFDFLYKRTSFRLMAEIFKSLFASFVKKGVPGCNKKVHKSFKQHIHSFTATLFQPLLAKLAP